MGKRTLTLKEKIKQYQEKHGDILKFYKSYGLLPAWEYFLLLDEKIITNKRGLIKIKNPSKYEELYNCLRFNNLCQRQKI